MSLSLDSLPDEVIEKVLDHIDLSGHLLSLALTSHHLQSIIAPFHIGCRSIRCFASNVETWTVFSDIPLYGQRVRRLHIGNGRIYDRNAEELYWFKPMAKFTHLTPLYMVEPKHNVQQPALKQGLSLLAKVIPHMAHLQRFICSIHEDAPAEYGPVFESITKYALQLRQFEFQYVAHRGNSDAYLTKLFSPINDLWQLTSVAIIIRDSSMATTDYISPFVDLVAARCPDLKELAMRVVTQMTFTAPTIFTQCTWPKLCQLTISGSLSVFNEDEYGCRVLRDFLTRHVNLEAFCLQVGPSHIVFQIETEPFQPPLLPKLRSLEIPRVYELAFIFSTIVAKDALENIVYFAGPILGECLELLHQMKNLKACCLLDVYDPDLIEGFVNAVPAIEKLTVEPFSGPARTRDEEDEISDIFWKKFVAILKLQNLTHLGRFMRQTVITTALGEEMLSQITEVRSLKYLEVGMAATEYLVPPRGMWIELERDEEGKYLGYHQVEMDEVGVNNWGNFFHGLV